MSLPQEVCIPACKPAATENCPRWSAQQTGRSELRSERRRNSPEHCLRLVFNRIARTTKLRAEVRSELGPVPNYPALTRVRMLSAAIYRFACGGARDLQLLQFSHIVADCLRPRLCSTRFLSSLVFFSTRFRLGSCSSH